MHLPTGVISCGSQDVLILLHFSYILFIIADKPPIEELHQFLEFQLPRQWAPIFSELPLGPQRKQHNLASLQFSLMGSKLYVNTTPVCILFSKFLFSAYCIKLLIILHARIFIIRNTDYICLREEKITS